MLRIRDGGKSALRTRTCPMLAAIAACVVMAASPARAQFGPGFTSTERYETGGGGRGKRYYGSVAYYPVAVFQESGYFGNEDRSGNRTTNGSIVALDFGLTPPTSRAPFELGGWYWERGSVVPAGGNSYIYQLHARAYFTPTRELGIQFGYLENSERFQSYTVFLVSDIVSKRISPNTRTPWALQAGVGIIGNPSYDLSARRNNYSRGYSLFISGSIRLHRRVSLVATEWYIRDRDLDYNRLALGFGYSF